MLKSINARKYIFIIAIVILLTMISSVKADSCTYKEQLALNKEASNIQKNYEFIEQDLEKSHFKVYISNISENLKVTITNDYDKREINLTAEDMQDGLYTIETKTASKKIKFDIIVYANSGTYSGQQLLRTSITTPRYNEYSNSYVCEQAPEYKLCGKFVDTSNYTYPKFLEKAQAYLLSKQNINNNKKLSFFDKIMQYIKEHYLLLIIIFGSIAIVIVAIILVPKIIEKKRGF